MSVLSGSRGFRVRRQPVTREQFDRWRQLVLDEARSALEKIPRAYPPMISYGEGRRRPANMDEYNPFED